MPISKYTILGERCSGTNFLAHAVYKNFVISYVHGHKLGQKHFFGHEPLISSDSESDQTIFLCIVRDTVSWIDSFFRTPHHVPAVNRTSMAAFMTNEWFSVDLSGQEIMADRNWTTGERYRNIMEMRRQKLAFFDTEIPRQTRRHMTIRYEDLRDNYDSVLAGIQTRFGLVRRQTNADADVPFLRVDKYKGTYNYDFRETPVQRGAEIEDLLR